jgi:oligosaccharyltransferase complex subunit alpha (ribophorin I)
MRPLAIATAVLSFAATALCAEKGNLTKPLISRLILPSNFKPPQTFKNVNLVHTINLEKSYPKESINVVIENIASTPQDEYYIPFTSRQMETIGGLEVKDRKDPDGGLFEVEAVEFDPERYIRMYNTCLDTELICLPVIHNSTASVFQHPSLRKHNKLWASRLHTSLP